MGSNFTTLPASHGKDGENLVLVNICYKLSQDGEFILYFMERYLSALVTLAERDHL